MSTYVVKLDRTMFFVALRHAVRASFFMMAWRSFGRWLGQVMRRSVWDDASFSSFCYYYLNLKNIYKISARVECRINIPLLQDINQWIFIHCLKNSYSFRLMIKITIMANPYQLQTSTNKPLLYTNIMLIRKIFYKHKIHKIIIIILFFSSNSGIFLVSFVIVEHKTT